MRGLQSTNHPGLQTWLWALVALAGCEGRATALRFTPDAGVDAAPPGRYDIELNPFRQLDLVFMIDNSSSMAPKQQKLRDNFPRLISALKNPVDGSLPDLRVAIIDSDLGTGPEGYASGSCGPKQLSDGTTSAYGDMGRFQMLGAKSCGVVSGDARWLEYANSQPVNFTGEIDSVFACLAGNLGTIGCGEEHQLQAFEFALVSSGVGNDAQRAMLRANANLGLVFLTDEDDCSAALNDGMFGALADLGGEDASLRCATRSAACGGKNLTSAPPGYPTSASFEAPFSTCAARVDACPTTMDGGKSTDTSKPTTCSPLRGVKRVVEEIKHLKAKPAEQLFVVGIFGWPLAEEDMASATYKIAPIPNVNTADTSHPRVYAEWPVCYDPAHTPTNPDAITGFDPDAAGWGALGGLRLAEFVNAFGDNGLKFSICQPDFSDSMLLIGRGMSRQMQKLCVPTTIDRFTACTVNFVRRDDAGRDVVEPAAIPVCDPQPAAYPCYRLEVDDTLCPGDNYYVHLDRGDANDQPIEHGTKLAFRCE